MSNLRPNKALSHLLLIDHPLTSLYSFINNTKLKPPRKTRVSLFKTIKPVPFSSLAFPAVRAVSQGRHPNVFSFHKSRSGDILCSRATYFPADINIHYGQLRAAIVYRTAFHFHRLTVSVVNLADCHGETQICIRDVQVHVPWKVA